MSRTVWDKSPAAALGPSPVPAAGLAPYAAEDSSIISFGVDPYQVGSKDGSLTR